MITEHPASVNVSSFNSIHNGEGLDKGAEGVICASSAVSRVLKILNDWVRERARAGAAPRARRAAASRRAAFRDYSVVASA